MNFNEHINYGITCYGIGDIVCSINALENMAIERNAILNLYVLDVSYQKRFQEIYESLETSHLKVKYAKDTEDHIENFSAFGMFSSWVSDWLLGWGNVTRFGQEYMVQFRDKVEQVPSKIGISFTVVSNPQKAPSKPSIIDILDDAISRGNVHYYGYRGDTDKWIYDTYKDKITFGSYELKDTIQSIRECSEFIGADSGMAWISAFGRVKTRIIVGRGLGEHLPKTFEGMEWVTREWVAREWENRPNIPKELPRGVNTIYELKTNNDRNFNSGIILVKDRYLVCFRKTESEIRLCWLDNKFNIIGNIYHPPIHGVTDPKLVQCGDNIKLCYSYDGYGCHLEYMEVCDVEIKDYSIRLLDDTKSRQLTIFDYPEYIKGREKSWAPFSHDDKLYFVYRKDKTHQVIVYDNELKCVRYMKDCIFPYNNPLSQNFKLHGNGNACKLSNEYLITSFHIDESHNRYRIGYYIFENKYPFKIVGVSKEFLIDSENFVDNDMPKGPLIGASQKCVFVGSWCNSIDENKLILSVGINDFTNYFLEYDRKYLLENVVMLSGYNKPEKLKSRVV